MNRTPLAQRLLLHVSLIALAASGAAWAVMKHLLAPVDEFSNVGHPLQPWAVAVHVAATPLAVFGVGWIFRDHIAGRFGRTKTPAGGSGMTAALALGPLVLTGVALQVTTNDLARTILGWTHIGLGALFSAVYLAHFAAARKVVRDLATGREGLVALVAGLLIACASSALRAEPGDCSRGIERARATMGTTARVVICERADVRAEAAASEALDAVERVDRTMSLYRPDSDLSRLNRDGYPGPVTLDRDLVALLDESAAISRETGGRFDVTVKPLLDYYGVYRQLGFAPPAGGLPGALERVGWRALAVDRARSGARFDRPGMAVDLGGIAKGFALDRARDALARAGIQRAILDLGRQLLLIGPGPEPGGRWTVGILDPAADDRVVGSVEIPPGSVSTSAPGGPLRPGGPVPSDEDHPGHVLDPMRGSVASAATAVTVWSPSGTRADALSTALLLLGPGEAGPLLRRSGEAAVFVEKRAGSGRNGSGSPRLLLVGSPEACVSLREEAGKGTRTESGPDAAAPQAPTRARPGSFVGGGSG